MQNKIKSKLTEAMKTRDTVRLSVLRGLVAAFTNESVAKGRKPDEKLGDEEVLVVIKRAVKQRKDSIEQFRKGNREDLASKEEAELKILETYLPAMMGRDEIEKKARELKEKMGEIDKTKIGQFMGVLMKELKGQADGTDVKEVVDRIFL